MKYAKAIVAGAGFIGTILTALGYADAAGFSASLANTIIAGLTLFGVWAIPNAGA